MFGFIHPICVLTRQLFGQILNSKYSGVEVVIEALVRLDVDVPRAPILVKNEFGSAVDSSGGFI